MDECGKCHAKWKKTVLKDHIRYDFIYVKCTEQVNLETEDR